MLVSTGVRLGEEGGRALNRGPLPLGALATPSGPSSATFGGS